MKTLKLREIWLVRQCQKIERQLIARKAGQAKIIRGQGA